MDEGRAKYSLDSNRSREARPAAIEPFGVDLTQNKEPRPEGPTTLYQVASIKFREAGQTYEADAGDRRYTRGDAVLVETQKGLALGFVAQNSERKFTTQPQIKILRRIEETDLRQVERNASREEEAFRFCLERIKARGLSMKLIRTEVLHGGNKAIFYFSAEGRIDFRELVKDLAHKFHLRIEMRQVGVRDEAKLMGGVGACGRELCCSTWLKDFAPVSLKMAKDQNLALNPHKVSGVCGRLMCCLSYEEDSYRELRKGLPKVGRRVMTPKGEGEVRELDVLRQRVRVSFEEFMEIFPAHEVRYSELGDEDEDDERDSGERNREERREKGRRMLERRGIIGSGEASAAASMQAPSPSEESKEEGGATQEAQDAQRPKDGPRPPREEGRRDRPPRGEPQRSPRDEQGRGRDERQAEGQRRERSFDDRRGPRPPQGEGPRQPRDERGPRAERPFRDDRSRAPGANPVNDATRPEERQPREEHRQDPRERFQRNAPRDQRGPRPDDRRPQRAPSQQSQAPEKPQNNEPKKED